MNDKSLHTFELFLLKYTLYKNTLVNTLRGENTFFENFMV